MTFEESYKAYGPDVERIAAETGSPPGEVDRQINYAMDRAYLNRQRRDREKASAPRYPKLVPYAGYDGGRRA